jgi:anti-sigma-K factor RskA
VTCADVRELLPALSLDALDVDDRDVVEDHLARCPACASELGAYQETAARLALAFPQHDPPSGLKRRVLAAATTRHPEGGRSAPWWIRLGLGFPRLQPAPVVAALALVVALSTTLWAAGLQMQLNEQRVLAAGLKERAYRYDKVVAVLQASDIQLRPMQGTELAPTATGRIYVDPENGTGMMMVRSLPRLPEGRVYQLWWARADGKRESGGVLTWTDPYGNGYTLITCPGPFSTWQTFGLTEEPAGGSPAPTGQRVIGGTI